MHKFHVIEDAAVITRARGVFRQTKVYRRGREIFAQHGGGFIQLYDGGGTSVPTVSWSDIDLGDGRACYGGQFGRLQIGSEVQRIAAE